MRRKFFALLLALAAASPLAPWADAAQRRRRPARRPAPAAAGRQQDARVAQLADAYLRGHFAFSPTEATAAGLHEFDARLEERSPEAVQTEVRRLRSALADLARVPEWRLSPEARYDFLVLQSHARARLLELEEVRMWRRDPNLYTNLASSAVDNILKRGYAPVEQRLDALLARERQIPRLLAEARQNLDDPPRLYTERAVAEARGAVEFFERVVPQMFERAGGSRLVAARRAEFHEANSGAVAALRSYAEWLERDLLPRSAGEYAVGAENFRRKLLYEEMIDTPAATLAREGERQLRETQDEMRSVAEQVAPGRGLRAALELLGRERPGADGLVGEARAELDRLRAFIRAEGLLTPPARENLTVAETPAYARTLSFASMDAAGPFERGTDESFYYVTPPDPAWDARRREEHLAYFNRYQLAVISMHEVSPGHYYQQLKARQSRSRVRAALGSAVFVEGWAHYCEQMMLDEGFGGNNPKLRLAQLSAALLRLCRYLAALRVHTSGMTYEEAVEFFAREGHLARTNAEREARRAAADPTTLVYTLGKMEILKLRDEWRRQMGDSFRLGEFHDRLLSYGMPPVRILRMAMLGDDGRGARADGGGGANQSEEARPLDFSVLAMGSYSSYEGARRVELITTPEEWARVWEVIGTGRPLPDVNFDTRAVIVAHQGQQRSGGYGIEITGVKRVGTVLAVSVNERRPASGDITTQALTSPFVAVSVPRPSAGVSVRFEDAGAGVEAPQPNRNRNVRPRPRPRRRGRRGR
ncbi:MAG TPA: DUF885 family protein [Pyrinomonadaceae bacterium]|nr:DUF885 family protein [Pyrinomonadaceae bacterium]